MTNKCLLSLMAGIARHFKSKINRIPICLTRRRKYEACFSNFFPLSCQGFSTNRQRIVSVIADAPSCAGLRGGQSEESRTHQPATQFPKDLSVTSRQLGKGGGQQSPPCLSLALEGGCAPQDLGLSELHFLCTETSKTTCRQRVPSVSLSQRGDLANPLRQTYSRGSPVGMGNGGDWAS